MSEIYKKKKGKKNENENENVVLEIDFATFWRLSYVRGWGR